MSIRRSSTVNQSANNQVKFPLLPIPSKKSRNKLSYLAKSSLEILSDMVQNFGGLKWTWWAQYMIKVSSFQPYSVLFSTHNHCLVITREHTFPPHLNLKIFSSPLLDITLNKPEPISPDMPLCAGYLDSALLIFQKHNHPFILVSTLAMIWSGSNNSPEREIDVLVRSSLLETLVNDLVASGEWKTNDDQIPDHTTTTAKSVWLKSCLEDPFMEYLRLWPEELYKLSIDCNKIEVPDIWAMQPVLLEEEYYRNPYERFGPPRLSTRTRPILPRLQVRAKIMKQEIPIFIPTIEDHLNAYLDQLREELDTRLVSGGYPKWQIRNFVRFLYLDWEPDKRMAHDL